MPEEWFEHYFDDLYLAAHGDAYDRAFTEAEFIVRALGLPSGSAILDLACGQGRHAVELAARGYLVTGLDLSRKLLQKAEEYARTRGVTVEFVEEDMRFVPETWAARFDGIISVFTSWGYFAKDEENEKVIEAVARSLKLAGRFLLDVINREWMIRHFRDTRFSEAQGGIVVLERSTLDLLRGRMESERTFILPDGPRVVRSVSIRLYTLAEIRGMFQRHGLTVREVYGDWSGEKYMVDSRRMIVVAERVF